MKQPRTVSKTKKTCFGTPRLYNAESRPKKCRRKEGRTEGRRRAMRYLIDYGRKREEEEGEGSLDWEGGASSSTLAPKERIGRRGK